MTKKQKIGLFIWFYIGWFGCIFFAKWNLSAYSWVFPIIALFYLVKFSSLSRRQAFAIFIISIYGISFDSLAYHFNLISFYNHNLSTLPTWLISMWFLFSAILPLAQPVFSSKPTMAALLAGLFGPLSYVSGESFLVLSFANRDSIVIYAIFWAVSFPGMLFFYKRSA